MKPLSSTTNSRVGKARRIANSALVPLAEIALDSGNYRPEDFIIPAADDKGHSEREWFRVQPGVDRQLDKIVQGRKFPFRTKGDIIRWCVMVGIQVIEALEPGIPSVTRQVDLISELVRDDQFHAEFETTFTAVSARVSQHLANGSTGEARRMIARMKAAIEGMPEGAWRSKYLERWKQQFGGQMSSAGKAAGTGKAGVMAGQNEEGE